MEAAICIAFIVFILFRFLLGKDEDSDTYRGPRGRRRNDDEDDFGGYPPSYY